MPIIGVTSSATILIQALADMRARLEDLQRQLATGEKSGTYAGLGPQRALAVGLQAQLDATKGFDDTIAMIEVRMNLAQNALNTISAAAQNVKHVVMVPSFILGQDGRINDQIAAEGQLDAILSALNLSDGTGYIFSGMSADKPPVQTLDRIMNGDATHAGFKQVLSERRQADLGANGLGRLVIPAAAGTVVSVSEDVAGSPFGFKLAGVNSMLAGANVTGPAGVPPSISVDLQANPSAGNTLTLTFTLPDGTSENVTLTATASATPGENEFTIGATAAATAANLQAALTTAVGKLADTALVAASAVAAGENFFNIDSVNPPMRVNGPPFDTATSLVAGSGANTVLWYTGESGATPARSTAVARVDARTTVAFGMRANEDAILQVVKNAAVFAAMPYSVSNPNAAGQHEALAARLASNFVPVAGQQTISDIQTEVSNAQVMANTVKERNRQSTVMLQDFLASIERVPAEQVGVELLSLQTALQASMQTTATLAKLTLVNYL